VLISLLLTSATLVGCKREERKFAGPMTEAHISQGKPNTPHRAGPDAPVDLAFASRSSDPDRGSVAYDLSQGQQLYHQMNCVGCHSNSGGGGIGPALSDDVWIYGWNPQVIFDSIVFGRPNGMPSFSGRMTDRQVWQLVAYVRSLSGIVSRQAATGRSDDMATGAAPNSLPRPTPRTSTAQRDELQRREIAVFQQLGMSESHTGPTPPTTRQ
jgi:cytochrome c oxidase cbb3-type subunit 3